MSSIYDKIPNLTEGMFNLPEDAMTKGIPIGTLYHEFVKNRKVYIDSEQFMKHSFFSGETGSGKTSILYTILQFLLEDIAEKPDTAPGFIYIDPVAKGANGLLTRIHKLYKENKLKDLSKVHYYKYTTASRKAKKENGEPYREIVYDLKNVPGHNFMSFDPEFDDVLATIERVWMLMEIGLDGAAAKAVKTEKYIKNALGALLLDREEVMENGKKRYKGIPHSITEVFDFIRSEKMRTDILRRIDPNKGQPYIEFWKRDAELTPETLDAIETRLYSFSASQDMRRVFGQKDESMDFSGYMDDGHIVIVDLGDIENESMQKMIASHIITGFYKSAKSDRYNHERGFFCFVDELTKAEVNVIPDITADARQFGFGFAPMTQEVHQLRKRTQGGLKRVANHFILRQSTDGAPVMNKIIGNAFSTSFLRELETGVVLLYTKAKVDGKEQTITCLLKAEPPFLYDKNGEIVPYKKGEGFNKEEHEARKFAYTWANEHLVQRDFKSIEEVDHEFFKSKGIAGVVSEPRKKKNIEGQEKMSDEMSDKKSDVPNYKTTPINETSFKNDVYQHEDVDFIDF